MLGNVAVPVESLAVARFDDGAIWQWRDLMVE